MPTCASSPHDPPSSSATRRCSPLCGFDLLRPIPTMSHNLVYSKTRLRLERDSSPTGREDLQTPHCCSPIPVSSEPFLPSASVIDPAYASRSAPLGLGCLSITISISQTRAFGGKNYVPRSFSFSALTLEVPKALEAITGLAATNREVRSRKGILFGSVRLYQFPLIAIKIS